MGKELVPEQSSGADERSHGGIMGHASMECGQILRLYSVTALAITVLFRANSYFSELLPWAPKYICPHVLIPRSSVFTR